MTREELKRRLKPVWPLVSWPVRLGRRWRYRIAAARLWASPRVLARTWKLARRSLAIGGASDRYIVAVDINPLFEPPTGVGWYLHRLLRELRDHDGLELRLYGPTMFLDDNAPRPAVELPRGTALRPMVLETEGRVPGLALRLLRRLEARIVGHHELDALWIPNFIVPHNLQHARGRRVVVVHDLAFRHFEWTLETSTLSALRQRIEHELGGAAAIITPSATVRQELLDAGLAPADRVHAVLHGPGHLAEEGEEEGSHPEISARRRPVEGRFALHVGTLEPRKNLETLLAAWRELRLSVDSVPTLVLCGARGWKNEDLIRQIESASAEGWLHASGYVDDGELRELYRHCDLVLCPSLYEGFGLPLAEALAAGKPVIASDIPVFREVAGEAARFVPAREVGAWSEAIRQLLLTPAGRCELARRARSRAAELSWRRAAEDTVQVLRPPAGAP